MKEQLESPRELPTPPEMLVRATLVLAVGAFAGGVLLMITGVLVAQAQLLVIGLMTLLVSWSARWWLHRRQDAPKLGGAISHLLEGAPAFDESRAAQLMTLLEQWEALEEKRGTPAFDPWALQAVRNDIRRVVESDPGLAELFDRLRQAT